MMRSACAIMVNTLRQAWHHRATLWLWLAAAAIALLLPRGIRGDGTPEGTFALLFTYIPIAIFSIVLIGSTWLGAHALAAERTHLRLSMLRTKPVSGFAIWLGQWLAIGMINSIALTFSMVLFFAGLHIHHPDLKPASQIVWQRFAPDESARVSQAQSIRAERMKAEEQTGRPAPSLANILNRLRQQQQRVAPSKQITWHIPVAANRMQRSRKPGTEHDPWRITFRWRLDPMRRQPVSGTWTLESHHASLPVASVAVSNLLDGVHHLILTDYAITNTTTHMELRFESHADNAPLIFFDVRKPVSLERHAGTLPANLARATLLMCVFAATLSAVALTLSACLSFPVAVFATHGILLAFLIAAFAGRETPRLTHSHGHTQTGISEWLLHHTSILLDSLHVATRDLRALLPFEALAENARIHLTDKGIVILIMALLLPLVCGLLTQCILARKEVNP